jgi:CheY-like chemotaxis protein
MRRVLFLDDYSMRLKWAAEEFEEDDLVAVTTAAGAIMALDAYGPWDLVMLDHDLGGEVFVDRMRKDCGMEVVRWIVREKPEITEIVVHSGNQNAAAIMVWALKRSGYAAEYKPEIATYRGDRE